jgi:DNA-binding transcriptional regulator YiaG
MLDSYATIAEDACLATEASSMSPKRYKEIIEEFGLSQEKAGEWLKVSARTGQNWAAKGPPEHVAMFLRFMIKHGYTPEDIR